MVLLFFDFSCRATQWPFWFGFLLPFLLLYIFDWIMFLVIFKSIKTHKEFINSQKENSRFKNLRDKFIGALSLAVMFGLGWGFGLLATSYPVEEITITIQVLFSIFVGIQGVLLFLIHGIRNPDARRVWKRLFISLSNNTTRFSYFLTSSSHRSTVKTPDSIIASQSSEDIRKVDLSKLDQPNDDTPPHYQDL